MREYTMTAHIYNRLKASGANLICRCGMEIKIGDKVVSRTAGGMSKRYHKKCWEEGYV